MEIALEARTAARNRYDLQELAGAFGDLGTLIPFVVGYITINHMDPAGILVGFGVFKLWASFYFKTPVPIQPMKAIGTAAITHGGAITPGAIFASGLFTGVVWGFMGLSGAVSWIEKITRRPVVQGIVLGLGLGFVVEGVKMTHGDLLLAAIAGAMTLLLLSYPLFGGLELAAGGRGGANNNRGALHHLPDGRPGDVEHGRGVPRGPAARHCLRAEMGTAIAARGPFRYGVE
jgi:hypothetical protein